MKYIFPSFLSKHGICLWVIGIFLFQGLPDGKGQSLPDSTRIYKQLQAKSKRSKFSKWLFENIIVIHDHTNASQVKKPTPKINPFDQHTGKIIRSIRIHVRDPFGQSVNDTASHSHTWPERVGNKIHVSSRPFLIRNQLLFEKFEDLDPLELSESERILRQAPYINDSRIYIGKTYKGKGDECDSVDVEVWVQDQWAIFVNSSFRPGVPDLQFSTPNFLGLGSTVKQDVGYRWSDKSWLLDGQYGVFNIRKSFLSAYLNYRASPEISTIGFNMDRPFYSPLTRWAGGVSVNRTYSYFYPDPYSPVVRKYPVTFDVSDAWAGKSWQIGNPKSIENRSTSIVAGIRATHTLFLKRPGRDVDVFFQNVRQTLYLGTIGISKRQFYKEKYLYRFGANEDVPIGYSFQFIGGHLNTEFQQTMFYSGLSGSIGRYFKSSGYFALRLSYGNFYNKSNVNRGVVQGNLNYFSNLLHIGDWAIRQFGSVTTTFGLHREPYEFLNLNGSQLYGFSSNEVRGKSKAILNLETVVYIPYNWFGFRFAPVLFLGFGKIGDNMEGVLNSRIFQAYSLGLLVRNENLIFNTFELSVGIYPYQPGNPEWYRLSPINSYRLKVRDFGLPKPEVLGYN